MNLFKFRSKKFTISDWDPTFQTKYLGNVLTTFVKGEGCVDRPVSILWNNYLANPSAPKDMQLTVTNSGIKAVTNEQGLMEYRCHRIAYCYHHPQFPKLFIWVYRHEGRKMKVEVRCHAVLCKSESKAKAIHTQLRDRLAFALAEYTREKTRRQNSRLILQRTRSVPCFGVGSSLPLRTQLLRVGQHFKPPSSQSTTAPSLGAISEELSETELEGDCPGSVVLRRSESTERNVWNGEEDDIPEEDDDDVFPFPPPDSIDCRITDILPSFFVNGRDSLQASSMPEMNGLFSVSDSHLDSAIVLASGDDRHPIENGLISHPTSERTSPEVPLDAKPSSQSMPELDNQSIESGFSEQDGHDL